MFDWVLNASLGNVDLCVYFIFILFDIYFIFIIFPLSMCFTPSINKEGMKRVLNFSEQLVFNKSTFQNDVFILYQRFSDAFRGYRKRTLAWYGSKQRQK